MWKINRKLAIVHVSGYGQTGPDKNKAAYDVSGQAMGGYMYMNGTSPTSPPLKVNPYLSDYATAYNACICALSIMTNARITGEGDACDVSQYETMFRLLGSFTRLSGSTRATPARASRSSTAPATSATSRPVSRSTTARTAVRSSSAWSAPATQGYPLVGLPTPGDGTDPDFPEGMTGSLKSLPR